MAKILIIEDELEIRRIIVKYLKPDNHITVEAKDGQEGLDLFDGTIDLIILDIMIPYIDGWSVCRRIRKESNVPIIMLTARTEEDDELMGLEMKADDYIKKPFSPAILRVRVKNCLSKKYIMTDEGKIERGDLVINTLARQVYVDKKLIELTMKEYDILLYLIKHEKTVQSREQILMSLWGHDYEGDIRVVDNHVKKLRQTLGEKAYVVRTVYGVGYKFEE